MSIETARAALGWCALLNYGFLALWGLLFVFARDGLLRLNARVFGLSVEQVYAVNYAGIVFYKVAIFLFNLVPFMALWIVG